MFACPLCNLCCHSPFTPGLKQLCSYEVSPHRYFCSLKPICNFLNRIINKERTHPPWLCRLPGRKKQRNRKQSQKQSAFPFQKHTDDAVSVWGRWAGMPFLSRNTDDAVSLGDSSLANSLALCPEGQPGICFDMQCFSLTQQCFLTKNVCSHTNTF